MRENVMIDRIEAADPATNLAPYGEEEIRRHVAAITAALPIEPRVIRTRRPSPAQRRWLRLITLAAAGAAALVAALALLPAGGSRSLPRPVEALAADLTRPGAIAHYVSTSGMLRTEAWVALDGSASRELDQFVPGGAVMETAVGARGAAVYSQRDNVLTRYRRVAHSASAVCLPCLVARLDTSVRDGLLRRTGAAVVDGRKVVVLRLAGPAPARLFVAETGGALVRIELDTQRGVFRQDFRRFEILDDTPAHRRLLAMSPHPGARLVQKSHGELP
jgi:hypothetical protein